MFQVPNKDRIRRGAFASDDSYGNNGAFVIPHPKINDYFFMVIASDGALTESDTKWEHISVHIDSSKRKVDRCPTWQEMCYVKYLFWSKDECVIQFHPAEVEYVNVHKTTLHLWKPVGVVLPIPEKLMVG